MAILKMMKVSHEGLLRCRISIPDSRLVDNKLAIGKPAA
jgi:hypothetical protein